MTGQRVTEFLGGNSLAPSQRLISWMAPNRRPETVKSRHLFRDFIDATATILIDERSITVRFQKRAHNPLLLAAGFDKTDIRIPWLNRRLRFQLG